MARLPAEKAARGETGGKFVEPFEWTPAGRQAHYQIAGIAARTTRLRCSRAPAS
jgi:hypothetical protein